MAWIKGIWTETSEEFPTAEQCINSEMTATQGRDEIEFSYHSKTKIPLNRDRNKVYFRYITVSRANVHRQKHQQTQEKRTLIIIT